MFDLDLIWIDLSCLLNDGISIVIISFFWIDCRIDNFSISHYWELFISFIPRIQPLRNSILIITCTRACIQINEITYQTSFWNRLSTHRPVILANLRRNNKSNRCKLHGSIGVDYKARKLRTDYRES